MTRFKVTICLVLVTLINSTVAENAQVEPSGSVFSSLLQSLSSSDRSPNCPGRCFNAIAALACQETLDTPGLCRKTGYRCCKNVAEKESSDVQIVTTAATSESPVTKEETQIPKDKEAENEKGETGEPSITKGIKTLRYSDDGTKEETDKKGEDNNQTIKEDEEIVEKMDEDEIVPQLYSSSAHSVEVCPGVCVAQRISNFCEAVIDVQGLCKPQLRCCVPAKLFDGVDIPPKEFKVLNAAESSNVTLEESRSEMTDLPKFETSVTTPSTTPKETTTEKKRTPVIEKKEIKNMDKVPLMEEDDGIPPEKRCTGTCIAGFFAFLCDSIDRNRECAGGGKCCIAPRKTKPGKNDKKEVIVEQPSEQSPPRSTTKKPKVQTTTRPTTPKPKTTTTERETTMEEPPPPCSGSCLSVEIASQCQHPSRLVASTGCSSDEICCEGKGKSPVKSPVKSSVSQVPEAFGTLLSLFGGGQPEKRPPPPPRRTSHPVTITTTAPTTTTPPTTAIPVTERPECTGTCISPILSFTCFGNAEMSDLFKCSKDKQSCCATKSAIRDLTRQHEIRNNARNDTVFPSVDPYYPLPSTVVRPPHSYTSEDDYHNPFYNFPSQEHVPFKPPPPPPSYQSSIYAQQSFDKPHKEHNIYTPYGQPHPVPPPQPPQPPMNPHTHSNAYIKPPHSNPIPPPPSTHGGQPQPHYNHDVNDRQPYLPTQATISQDAASSSSSQVHFLGGSPHVDNKYVCGVKGTNRVARVVGGEDAVPGEWCWQVALINSLNQYLCGGALIGTQWVLTAAHCVTNIVRSGDAIYVRVGDHDLTTRFGSPGAQTLPVATTYIHHNHNSQTLDNDIALLKLSSHAELGNGVCLACLPARGVSQVAGKRCTVTGYGYMGETGPIPLRVREAEIPVVSDNECVRKINAVTEKIFILPASSFCAGGESGHDACQGDGGGPLVCNVDGYFELSGLVSWGFGCGRQDVPGVYVKVSSFIGWVNQIISVNNL